MLLLCCHEVDLVLSVCLCQPAVDDTHGKAHPLPLAFLFSWFGNSSSVSRYLQKKSLKHIWHIILKMNSTHTTQLETKFEKESWVRNLGQGCFYKEQESFSWSVGENVLFSRGLGLSPSLVASEHCLLSFSWPEFRKSCPQRGSVMSFSQQDPCWEQQSAEKGQGTRQECFISKNLK